MIELTAISYNHLNLPSKITFKTATANVTNSIEFLYDASGAKWRKTVTTGIGASTTYYKNRYYFGGIEYNDSGIDAIYFSEGRYIWTTSKLEFTLSDHLGNARVQFSDNNSDGIITPLTEMIQVNHYYPFGLNQEGQWAPGGVGNNKYQYNGKELNDDFALNWNDYGARWYDAAIGRWTSVDPLAEKMKKWSPYNYGFDNPMRFVDPKGMAPDDIIVKVDSKLNKDQQNYYKQEILKTVQKLTNDVLKYDGNKITVDKKNEGTKTEGTKLVRSLIENDGKRNVTIAPTSVLSKQSNATTLADVSAGGTPDNARNGVGVNAIVAFDVRMNKSDPSLSGGGYYNRSCTTNLGKNAYLCEIKKKI